MNNFNRILPITSPLTFAIDEQVSGDRELAEGRCRGRYAEDHCLQQTPPLDPSVHLKSF